MLLSFLFSLAISKKVEKIEDMDRHRFKNTVLEGRKITVYVALLSNPDFEGHTHANEVLEEAFQIGKGFLKFCYLDTSKDRSIARKFNVTEPIFGIFHAGGHILLPAHNITARILVNKASFMIPDFTMKITNELDESYITPVVVLFTERKIPPSLWTAISYEFRDKQHLVKIGFSNNKTLASHYNITEFPKLLMKNSSKTLVYDAISDFPSLKDMITKFYLKRLTSKVKQLIAYPLKTFRKRCSKADKICIVHTTASLQDDFLRFRKMYTTSLLDFLYGNEKFPYDFMKNDTVYGFRVDSGQYFETDNLEDLEFLLPQVLTGKNKWQTAEL